MVSILLFGELAELAGESKICFEDVNDTDSLKEAILSHYPALKTKSFLIAMNKKIITETTEIGEDAEIALLPPFSGG
jgi:sulfur-carrier protein